MSAVAAIDLLFFAAAAVVCRGLKRNWKLRGVHSQILPTASTRLASSTRALTVRPSARYTRDTAIRASFHSPSSKSDTHAPILQRHRRMALFLSRSLTTPSRKLWRSKPYACTRMHPGETSSHLQTAWPSSPPQSATAHAASTCLAASARLRPHGCASSVALSAALSCFLGCAAAHCPSAASCCR